MTDTRDPTADVGGTAPDAAPASEVETLKAALAAAEAKASEQWDRALRATAELENVRRRTERDSANAVKYSLERILAELIGVNDSLELALKAAEAAPGPHLEGLQLTHKQFWATLQKNGVSQVDPAGQAFNPELHEAVSMQESAEVAPNHVLHVMQKGYKLHDRVLRPAMVVVARAPATH